MKNAPTKPKKSDVLVVVPMKAPHVSKSRLSHVLDDRERSSLARTLFSRTLKRLLSLQQAGVDFDIVVVTKSAEIAQMSVSCGVSVIDETDCTGLSDAIDRAAIWAEKAGYLTLCVLPADLAGPKLSEIEKLIAFGRKTKGVVVCPSNDLGTNALSVSPPRVVPFAFGENSAVHHLRLAETLNVKAVLWPLPSLRDDVDTADCLTRAFLSFPELRSCLKRQ